MPFYVAFSEQFKSLKGAMKDRRGNLFSVDMTTDPPRVKMSLMASTFITALEDYLKPKPSGIADSLNQPEEIDREVEQEDDDEPDAYRHSKGTLDIPVISHWVLQKSGVSSVGKTDISSKEPDKKKPKKEVPLLGKRSTYEPVPVMRAVNYELWFGDARKTNVHDDPSRTLAAAVVGDVPYGFNKHLSYDAYPWNADDVRISLCS